MDKNNLYPTEFNKNTYKEMIKKSLPSNQNAQMPVPQPANKHQIQNPFDTNQFGGGGLPDVPLQMNNGISEMLLGDRDIPARIKEPFWYVFIKDNILTFLDQDRKEAQMLNFDIVKIDTLNSTSYYDYDFSLEKDWNVLRNIYETKLNRSLGFKGKDIRNERILLQSQIIENKNILEQSSTENKGGFLGRLLGRR